MEKKSVVDKRHIRLEEVMKKDFIPFLGGRPKRETVITLDDVLNLAIILHTSVSVEDTLKKLLTL